MTFQDLPPGWDQHPLTDDRRRCDALDLFTGLPLRLRGGLLVLLCDDDGRPLQPLALDDLPRDTDDLQKLDTLWRLARIAREAGAGSLAVAIGRRTLPRPGADTDEQAWARALAVACADHGLRDLGCAVAAVDAVVPLVRREAA